MVNDDVRIVDGLCPYNASCSMKNLSCRYLAHLNNHTFKEYYVTLDAALQAVTDGEAWGALYFNENYTDSLVARLALGNSLARSLTHSLTHHIHTFCIVFMILAMSMMTSTFEICSSC